MNRGDIVIGTFASYGRRPAVIVTKDTLVPLLTQLTVAPITSRGRGLPTEVHVDIINGIQRESYINCTALQTVDVNDLSLPVGALNMEQIAELDDALRTALDLDSDPEP